MIARIPDMEQQQERTKQDIVDFMYVLKSRYDELPVEDQMAKDMDAESVSIYEMAAGATRKGSDDK